MRQIGNSKHEVGQLGLHNLQLICRSFELVTQTSHLIHDSGGIFAFAFEDADLFGKGVALGLQLLGAALYGFALGFEGIESRHIQLEFALRQALGDVVDVLAEELDVDHGNEGLAGQR